MEGGNDSGGGVPQNLPPWILAIDGLTGNSNATQRERERALSGRLPATEVVREKRHA